MAAQFVWREGSWTFTCSLVTTFRISGENGMAKRRQGIVGPVPKRGNVLLVIVVRNNDAKARNSNLHGSQRDLRRQFLSWSDR